jgi:hypothetical protein
LGNARGDDRFPIGNHVTRLAHPKVEITSEFTGMLDAINMFLHV